MSHPEVMYVTCVKRLVQSKDIRTQKDKLLACAHLIDQSMGDDCPQGRIVQFEQQVTSHEVPDTKAAPVHHQNYFEY